MHLKSSKSIGVTDYLIIFIDKSFKVLNKKNTMCDNRKKPIQLCKTLSKTLRLLQNV